MAPVVAAVIISAVGVGSGSIAAAVISVAVGLAFSALTSSLFGKKPEKPNAASGFSTEKRDRSQTFRSSIAERRIVYGRVKVSGPLIFAASNGEGNKFLHMIVAMANHECYAIHDIYLDDRISLDSLYAGVVETTQALGTDDQFAFSNLVAENVGWTSEHRMRGVAGVYVKLTYDQDKFPNGAPANIAALILGKKLYDLRTGTTGFSENPALMIYDYLTGSYGLGVDSTEIDSASFIAAANICEERILLAANSVNFSILSNIGAGYNALRLDNVHFNVRTGDGVRLSTTGTLPGGLSAGVTYYVIEYVNFCLLLATSYSNSISATPITITDSGSGIHTLTTYDQVRYSANGTIALDQAPIDLIDNMLTCMGGALSFSQGKYFLHAAAYSSPVMLIDEDNLIGPVNVRPTPPKRELFNAIRGTFVDPSKFWQPSDFPLITNLLYETEDGGERVYRDIELPFTIDPTRAQRIAKIHLEKSRQGITVDLACDLSVLKLAVFDVVQVSISSLGWSNKEFRVLSWELRNDGGINLTLQEEASASYDWNNGDATTYDPAPNTNLPSPTTVTAPGNPVVTEELYETIGSSGVKARANMLWASPNDGFVIQFEAQYKKTSDSTWIQIAILSNTVTSTVIPDIQPDIYDFRVRSINGFGVRSSWATTSNIEIYGLTALPADITNFSLNAINNSAHLSWNQATDLDVRVGGNIRLRYSPQTSGATWSTSIDLGNALPGITTMAVVPLLTGTYLIKAVDSSGNESLNATTITSTVANIVKMNAVATITENPSFAGVKVNTILIGSVLRLDSSVLWDDAPGLWDDLGGFWDNYGGNLTSGLYRFANTIDLGKVTTSRLTASIAAIVYDSTQTWDEKLGLWDDAAGMWDGDDITGVDVSLYVRTTNDNPLVSGGPEWSEWRKFFVGDYVARAFEFELRITSDNQSYNVDISTLSVTADVPDITDSGTLTTSALGATTITYDKTFVITTPKVGVTIQNGSTGDYLEITNITSSSFDIAVKNAAGSFVARTISWQVLGY